jgi:hypothetical protein
LIVADVAPEANFTRSVTFSAAAGAEAMKVNAHAAAAKPGNLLTDICFIPFSHKVRR